MTKIDHAALRVNQSSIILCLAVAFLADWVWLVAFVAAVMAVGTIWPRAGLFKQIYLRVLGPAGLVKPDPKEDSPQPHLFAQGLGAVVLAGASVALGAGGSVVGWLLVALVVVLAGVNLFLGFCLGCFVYYQLERRGVHASLSRWDPVGAVVEDS